MGLVTCGEGNRGNEEEQRGKESGGDEHVED